MIKNGSSNTRHWIYIFVKNLYDIYHYRTIFLCVTLTVFWERMSNFSVCVIAWFWIPENPKSKSYLQSQFSSIKPYWNRLYESIGLNIEKFWEFGIATFKSTLEVIIILTQFYQWDVFTATVKINGTLNFSFLVLAIFTNFLN